jgi:hypothetical protein
MLRTSLISLQVTLVRAVMIVRAALLRASRAYSWAGDREEELQSVHAYEAEVDRAISLLQAAGLTYGQANDFVNEQEQSDGNTNVRRVVDASYPLAVSYA